MNKSQLIDALAERFDGSRKDAAQALDAVLSVTFNLLPARL
jgi:DNA-binding protein HU-beta